MQKVNLKRFVVCFSDGGRCKVKFEAYRLAHGAPRSLCIVKELIGEYFTLVR